MAEERELMEKLERVKLIACMLMLTDVGPEIMDPR